MAYASTLLDLILGLLSDGSEAEKFAENPDEYLKEHGLEGVCGDDVKDVAPLVLDYAPVTVQGSFDRSYDTGNHGSAHGGNGHAAPPPPHGGGKDHDGGHHGDDDKGEAIKEITNILNSYSYTSVDDRDTLFDQSVNQNIFAKGDVKQEFDYDTVVASGDGAVAAGGDVEGAITGDGNAVGDGNTVTNGDDNIVGDENEVGNTDNSVDVDIEDSFQDNSTDNSVNDSFDDNDLSTDNSINESFDDNDLSTDNSDNSVNDSNNDNSDNSDSSTNVDADVDVEIDKSFNDIAV